MLLRVHWRRLTVAALIAMVGSTAHATQWPERPIRFVVPWPAGGLNDAIARVFNNQVSQTIGESVVTEFKAGAAGRIGISMIARATPDGYTIGMGNLGPLTIFPSLYQQLDYNVQQDLKPVAMFAASPLVLVVSAESPIPDVDHLLEAARSKPGVYNFASVGLGGPQHLTYELLKQAANVDIVHVPYKGTNESLPALLANQVQSTFDTLPSLLPLIRAGKLRPLAVTSATRVPQLPDVPTLKELSLVDFEVLTWYALIAPAKTPKPIIDKLYQQYTAAAQTPTIKKFMDEQGLIYVPNTESEFMSRIETETQRWAELIQAKNIKVTQ